MDLIEGSFAVAAFIVIALPGLIYSTVRRWARGEAPEDRDFGLSVARGAVFAVALTGLYALALGGALAEGVAAGVDADTLVVRDVRRVALIVIGLYVVVPALIALAVNHRHLMWQPVRGSRWLRYPRSSHGYSSTPAAWDHAARLHQASWVKVRKSNGDWVGGWFTQGSFASVYPEPRSIYIDQQYEMTSEGNFGNAVEGAGLYVSIGDEDVVIWVRSAPQRVPERTVS